MKLRIEVEATYYAVWHGFTYQGVYSAYQLAQLDWELKNCWFYPVV